MASTTEQLESDLAEALQMAADMEEELQEKTDRIEQLENSRLGGAGAAGQVMELEEEIKELSNECDRLREKLQEERDAGRDNVNKVRDLEAENEQLKMENLNLTNDLRKAEERAEVAEEAMHKQTKRTEAAVEAEGRLGQREKGHKRGLIKALSENEEMRKEIADLQDDVQTLYNALKEQDEETKKHKEELQGEREKVMQAEGEVQELKALMKQNEDEIRKKEDELAAMAEIEQGWQNRAKDLAESWGDKVKEVNKQLEKERREVLRLERLVQQLKNDNAAVIKKNEAALEAKDAAITELGGRTQRMRAE